MAVNTEETNANNNTARQQQSMLAILKYIDKVCKENNITYFLYYGTLLGAIRHQGFIPWDDDADIALPRSEYDRFIEVFSKEKDERFVMKCRENTDGWLYGYARVLDTNTDVSLPFSKQLKNTHVFVDVFPLDSQPANDTRAKLHYYYMNFLTHMAKCADHTYFSDKEKQVKMKKVFKPIADLFGVNFWTNRIDKVARKRDFDDERFTCATALDCVSLKTHVQKKWLKETMEVDFCDTKLTVPVNYEEILTELYHDYMQLPPEDKRVGAHGLYEFKSFGND